MSKPSRRPNRENIKEQRKQKKAAEKHLRQQQLAQGLTPTSRPTSSNATGLYKTVAEETAARTQALTEQVRLLKAQLPVLLSRLNQIPDPRNPKKLKHKLTHLLLYGLLMFVYQYASRRQVNREMTLAMFHQNLSKLFPELEQLPHADTLYRLLEKIDVEAIQKTHIEFIRKLMKGKKFRRYLINNCYPVAIDGTQKLATDVLWEEELLQRKKKKSKEDDEHDSLSYQYYVYVLEANLAFQNGMVVPLLSEFLEFEQGDKENNKQDCENRAFKRLAKRLKDYFPKLQIMLLLDGLYPNGPIMRCCLDNKWQFMIVLPDKSLSSVWEEYRSLMLQQPHHVHSQIWGIRHQRFRWVNQIVYYYGPNECYTITLHVVVCEEHWQEVDEHGDIKTQTSRHVWISSRTLNKGNVHARCNLGARHRWGIEAGFLVEKHQGYSYEHCFAQNFNAMKGYHYLMRIAHTFNILARFSKSLKESFKTLGVRGFIAFVRDTLKGPWLDPVVIRTQLARPFQLRLE